MADMPIPPDLQPRVDDVLAEFRRRLVEKVTVVDADETGAWPANWRVDQTVVRGTRCTETAIRFREDFDDVMAELKVTMAATVEQLPASGEVAWAARALVDPMGHVHLFLCWREQAS